MSEHYLTAAAVFRQESPFLREWVAYHKLVGVEKFFLFDNNIDPEESARSVEVLRPHIEEGLVVVQPFMPSYWLQWQAYEIALNAVRGKSVWMALMDLDEFYVPEKGESLSAVLRRYEDDQLLASLSVHWKVFGTSGHKTRQPLQLEAFTKRGKIENLRSATIKSIVRPERIVGNGGHTSLTLPGLFAKNTEGVTYMYEGRGVYEPATWRVLSVHHYSTRSHADWNEKARRGWRNAEHEVAWSEDHWKKRKLKMDLNDETDTSALRFVPAVKAELKRISGT